MKYYVILNGEYSDTQILGVTNNHDKAIKFSQLYSTYDNPCYIEEYEEPELHYDENKDHLYYHIEFKKDTVIEDECYCFCGQPDKQLIEYGDHYGVNIKAKNQRDAIKKASDLLAKYKALKIEYGKMIDDLVQHTKDRFDINDRLNGG